MKIIRWLVLISELGEVELKIMIDSFFKQIIYTTMKEPLYKLFIFLFNKYDVL